MTVDLVRRDPAGKVISGTMLAPDEAHRLGQALIANAFDVGSSARGESKGDPVKNRHMTTPEAVARVVHEERAAQGWTHAELACRANVDEQFVAQLERGHDRAALAQVLAVLDVLNVHATALPSTAPEDNIHAIIDAHI
ncbi:helix-turn-helix domain-containing protein [Dermacoccus sp. 147Ba]|uniref:helix-turn-helix domain-containing protein n=1 Tax=Dermacoccus sp. 147Ba TaxID=2510111 RepID=UPI0013EA55E6|nr:helix-turn-helix transcriptional regulator [Dermacoccus sp. 147Ba]